MSERLPLPVLPLRDMVLFPGVTTPVGAGRPATLRAIEAALKTESRLIFAVAQRDNVDTVSPALLYGMGTIARIGQVQPGLGGVQLVLHGVLGVLSVEERLRRVLVHVQRQIGVLNAQEDIKSQVQEELGERQREMILREQLKAIRKELGEENEGGDVEDLRKRLAALELPEAAKKEVDRELSRLERASRDSMEAQVIRTYLETVAELPWNKRTEESLDLKRAAEILEEDHYGLKDVKDQVLEFLAVRQLRRQQQPNEEAPGNEDDRAARAPTLLFVGPPGVGKTSIAKSIARAMGRPYVRISLGGARDEADIRGHRRTYVGAMPGRIIQGMKQAGAKNPIFLLDEVDKLGVSFQGDPAAALLEVLDPAQNDSFTDPYLGGPFDLSEGLFIAPANFLQSIPAPLLDRLETVTFAGYTEREKLEIAKRYLVPRQLHENGLTPEQLTITDAALSEIITRSEERRVGKECRSRWSPYH